MANIPDVRHYVFDDPKKLEALTQGTNSRVSQTESLLLCEHGDDLLMSLFLDSDMLSRLKKWNPFTSFGTHNANDFWAVLEGVSHFVYAATKATRNQSFSILELELQAEVDKFIASLLLLGSQGRIQSAAKMHNSLFEDTELVAGMTETDSDRYRFANDYAARYCWSLLKTRIVNEEHQFSRELRHFYQLSQHSKIRRIDNAMYHPRVETSVS